MISRLEDLNFAFVAMSQSFQHAGVRRGHDLSAIEIPYCSPPTVELKHKVVQS